jgi:SAM-dependent methyltransferase
MQESVTPVQDTPEGTFSKIEELANNNRRLRSELEQLRQEKAHLLKENTWFRMQLEQFQREQAQFRTDHPHLAGTGQIAAIVPPIAGERLRVTVSSPSMAGYLFTADAWHCVLTRFLKERSTVLDIGCGCGKMARNLLYHPHIKRFIGIDAYEDSINYCREIIAPRSGGRFEFHFLDVHTEAYNPQGKIRGTEVAFPTGSCTVDFAYAASLFTHLLEEDSRHYLREVRRVLAAGGLFLPSIHVNPTEGSEYSGNEIRVDVRADYFIKMAQDAGLRLVQHLGSLCGQESFLFTTA